MMTKILSLRDFSISFNLLNSDDFVLRENYIHEIEELASLDYKLIIVDGSEGIGKTNLLLQFAKKHHLDSFAYFINPASKATARQDFFMQDIGQQLYFHIHSDKIESENLLSESDFKGLLLKLAMKTPNKPKILYFILDGLDQIDNSEIELLKPIINELPWNANNFRFIVSGSQEKLIEILPKQVFKKSKVARVLSFNYEETLKFFTWPDSPSAKEIYDTWKGNPERLSQIKRILSTGIELNDFLSNDIREKEDLYESEWSQASLTGLDFQSEIIKVICILAFEENIQSFENINKIIVSDDDNLKSKLEKLTFLNVKENDISYISSTFKKFAIKKLHRYERVTSTLLISYYQSMGNELISVQNLPSLYNKSQDWEKLVNHLSVNNLGLLFVNSQSFSDIKKQLNYGYRASTQLKKAYNNIFKFSLYRSLVNGLQKSDVRESQIEAYISLNQLEDAFSLISKAVLKEDKLKMLIKYGKECKIQKYDIEPLVIKDIQDMLNEVDNDYLKENIVDIAIGLAHFLPEDAVKVIERAYGKDSKEGSLEWILSYIAYLIKNESNANGLKSFHIEVIKLSKNFSENFANSIAFGINNFNENEILEELSKITNVQDRLYLIKSWILKNKKAKSIGNIVDYALNVVVESSSGIKPTSTVLFDIAQPLVNIEDKNLFYSLIKRLDELIEYIQNPTNDKIKLQLLIIESLAIHNINDANERILDLYDYIYSLTDYSVKIEAFSNCWKLVRNLQENENVKYSDFLLNESDVKKDILTSINIFLDNTAEHYKELRNTFEIIPKIDLQFSIDIANKLNILPRRSASIVKSIEIYCTNEIKAWDIKLIKNTFSLIKGHYFNQALLFLFDAASEQREQTINYKHIFLEFLPLITGINDLKIKTFLVNKAIIILLTEPTDFTNIKPKYSKPLKTLTEHLNKFWSGIEDPIEKIKIGYTITSSIAKYDLELSKAYFKATENFSEECAINNQLHNDTYLESLRLMIRIYTKIIIKNNSLSYEKITQLIDYIPSNIDKIKLWSELAVRAFLNGGIKVCEDVVKYKINLLLDPLKSKPAYYEAISYAASAVYLAQPDTLKLLIKNLTLNERESIISDICEVLISRVHESEPYYDTKGSRNFKYKDMLDYIQLLEELESDYIIHNHINNLCTWAKSYPSANSREQNLNLYNKINQLIDSKLPNTITGITHKGFLIACKASSLHFKMCEKNAFLAEIDALENEALKIANISDRAFVLILISKECTNHKKKKQDLLIKSLAEADKLFSIQEKVSTYSKALDELSGISSELYSQKLSKIQQEIFKLDENSKYPTYKNLIDLVYKYDKQLAKRVVNALDSDPARKQLQEPILEHFEQLELENSVLEDYNNIGKIKNRKIMGQVVNRMLGELNCNKRNARSLEETIPLIYTASKLPFFYSLPLFEFFIENIQEDSGNDTLLTSLYDSIYSSAKLCYNLICNISNKKTDISFQISSDPETNFVGRPGMRDDALKFIERFIKQNKPSEIFIVDPYFTNKEVAFIKDISNWSNKADIMVLTSHCTKFEFSRVSFMNEWREVSAENPPNATFICASNEKGETPFHDRWIILKDTKNGIRLGTSIGSIGGKKITEFSIVNDSETLPIIEKIINPFIIQRLRNYNSQTIKYESFDF